MHAPGSFLLSPRSARWPLADVPARLLFIGWSRAGAAACSPIEAASPAAKTLGETFAWSRSTSMLRGRLREAHESTAPALPRLSPGIRGRFVLAADGAMRRVLAHFLDRGPEHQLDAAPSSALSRNFDDLGSNGPEQAVGHVDEDNLDPVRPDFPEKARNVFVPHLRAHRRSPRRWARRRRRPFGSSRSCLAVASRASLI